MTIQEKLEKAGIRHFDVLIHDQPKGWLIENFGEGATEYPVNVSVLMRNIIWQTREMRKNIACPECQSSFPGQVLRLSN